MPGNRKNRTTSKKSQAIYLYFHLTDIFGIPAISWELDKMLGYREQDKVPALKELYSSGEETGNRQINMEPIFPVTNLLSLRFLPSLP